MRANRFSGWELKIGVILVALLLVNHPHALRGQPERPLLFLHQNQMVVPVAWQTAVSGGYHIIQFDAPISADRQAALRATGVAVLEYLPDYAYLVRGDATQLAAAINVPGVAAERPLTLADKIAPALLRAVRAQPDTLEPVRIISWPQAAPAAQTLPDVVNETAVTPTQLRQLAALPAVRWIEPVTAPTLFNDRARQIMGVDAAWNQGSLFGAGQIVAVADSGLDTGPTGALSPDFAGRIHAAHALVEGAQWDDNFGHGTHVAGSVLGAGVQSGADPAANQYAGSFAGVAPQASLVVQAFETTAEGAIIGLPEDYYSLFAQAYADGARLHNNSWGGPTGPQNDLEAAFGGYPYGSQRTDAFMWAHPEMLIVAAAGNSGVDGTPVGLGFCSGGDGVIDPDSLASPATAKNTLTVGATESERPGEGAGDLFWFLLGFCYLNAPINFDLIANNANGMAAFSSRGPTDDGRIKPDIVAPGTNILSNRSFGAGAGTLWAPHDSNDAYAYSGGTSMAAPLVTGAAALVREWVQSAWEVSTPSAALVKGVLLNTAVSTAPGQYGTGATQEIPFTTPNAVAGWGRAALDFLHAPEPFGLWLDDARPGLQTGDVVTYDGAEVRPLTVVTDTLPLRVTLVWTDPPASLSASKQLVNDLDLVVTGPDGETIWGNDAAGGDRLNNVEGVIISQPALGDYQIQVRAHNVPIEMQPYALVVSGPLGEGVVEPPEMPYALYLPAVIR